MKEVTSRAVSNIICSFLLGKRFDYDDPYFRKFITIFDQVVSNSGLLFFLHLHRHSVFDFHTNIVEVFRKN